MNVVAIVQARMGSTRLPGKVLLDVAGRSMLARVVRRVRRAALIDRVVVATSVTPDDDRIVDECRRLSVACFRGSEDDVLDRFHRAARACRAEAVVRITADCPLIDPEVTDRVLRAFLDHRPDYASNTLDRTYPRGLDTEVADSAALARAWRDARQPYERTHVMPYIYRHPDAFRLLAVTGQRNLSQGRWTVDSPDDLRFVRAVYNRMGSNDRFSWRDVVRLVDQEPSLASMNRHVRQKQLAEG
ncbi:MAG: cytidylyltransferase domain-containing protein [Planctomycetota bacterium]|jgi:spore coat polysaccharide biosynthesis protein SpsF